MITVVELGLHEQPEHHLLGKAHWLNLLNCFSIEVYEVLSILFIWFSEWTSGNLSIITFVPVATEEAGILLFLLLFLVLFFLLFWLINFLSLVLDQLFQSILKLFSESRSFRVVNFGFQEFQALTQLLARLLPFHNWDEILYKKVSKNLRRCQRCITHCIDDILLWNESYHVVFIFTFGRNDFHKLSITRLNSHLESRQACAGYLVEWVEAEKRFFWQQDIGGCFHFHQREGLVGQEMEHVDELPVVVRWIVLLAGLTYVLCIVFVCE